MDWDVFISHASEDKESFARPLAKALEWAGLRVWFDEFTLTVGDSLRRSIDHGLANSRYGIVILSPNFFAKKWPQKELDGLASREVSGEKVILPVWHNITAEQIRGYSPTLADLFAVSSSRGLEDVVTELLRAMKWEREINKKRRRIDAAVPSDPQVGQRIDLLVQVRFPDSRLLGTEDWPTKQKPCSIEQVSESVALGFPIDHRTGKLGSARLQIRIVAPDFAIEGAAQQFVEVPPDRYSKRISFLLTAMKAGRCRINVEVHSVDDTYLGTIPLETTVSGTVSTPGVSVAVLVVFVLVHQPGDLKTLGPDALSIEERSHLWKLLKQRQSNLYKLEEKTATYAAGEVPLSLENQIEAERQAVAEIKERLAHPETEVGDQQTQREESEQLPKAEIVPPSGKLVRGSLVKVLQEKQVSIGIASLIFAVLACIGTYLTVPQVQTFISLRLATATATLPLRPTSTLPIATYTPLQTLMPTFTIAPSPTSSPTLTVTPIPTPDCRGVQISKSLELDLATKLGQKKDPDANGVIVLTTDDLDKLQILAGRAILTETDVAEGCGCEWHGQVNGSDIPAQPSPIKNCRFSFDIGEQPTTISLWLTVGTQTKLFTIKVR